MVLLLLFVNVLNQVALLPSLKYFSCDKNDMREITWELVSNIWEKSVSIFMYTFGSFYHILTKIDME
jgi:hypothetical protein